ncbi:hypothetical protein F5Y15DRAFT_200966 [Xylariaceae sp. FL0016]|nr:hypothetical protein F5Y15DRAFT_200966 [Xylariaceae sp. FL0016]
MHAGFFISDGVACTFPLIRALLFPCAGCYLLQCREIGAQHSGHQRNRTPFCCVNNNGVFVATYMICHDGFRPLTCVF